ncbi:hypothetical protein HGRIS_006100 [Hohenbuehelia grisea]|uniref:Uncharacterized protein n=1 Tax=Hohenbuehelia grisea TaxID=104357 RepID=A0ABR3JZC1_9AGAR
MSHSSVSAAINVITKESKCLRKQDEYQCALSHRAMLSLEAMCKNIKNRGRRLRASAFAPSRFPLLFPEHDMEGFWPVVDVGGPFSIFLNSKTVEAPLLGKPLGDTQKAMSSHWAKVSTQACHVVFGNAVHRIPIRLSENAGQHISNFCHSKEADYVEI